MLSNQALGKNVKTLYLRGISESVVREAKALAARRGMTLAALVTETLARVIDAEPVDRERLPRSLQGDQDWYEANREKLLERYEGEYLVIVGQRVVDHDRDFGRLAGRVFHRMGRQPLFVPKCTGGDRRIAVATPRR